MKPDIDISKIIIKTKNKVNGFKKHRFEFFRDLRDFVGNKDFKVDESIFMIKKEKIVFSNYAEIRCFYDRIITPTNRNDEQ